MALNSDTVAFIDTNSRKSNVSTSTRGSLPSNYHEGELKIHNRINNTAIGIIIAGFLTIFSSFLYMVFTKDIRVGGITTLAGVFSEAVSGILFWYVTKASDDKWKYFRALNEDEEEKRLLLEIDKLSNEKFREKMVERLVDTYCKSKGQ